MKIRAIALSAMMALGIGSAPQAQTVGIVDLPTGFGSAGGVLTLGIRGSYGPVRGLGTPQQTRFDASTNALLGFGNPASGVGLEVGITNLSFRDFGASGYVDLGVHRLFQFDDSGIGSVSLRAAHIAPWGNATALRPSYTLAASYMTGVGDRLVMFTASAGTAFNNARTLRGAVGVGVSLSQEWSISAGYAGDRSVLGASWNTPLLRGIAVSFSLSALERPAARTVAVNLSRSFSLTR